MDDMGGMAMDDAGDMAATGMAGAGWSLAAFAAFVVAWAVMMAAMMFPAAAPMLLLFRTVATPAPGQRQGLRPDLGLRRRLPAGLDGGRRDRPGCWCRSASDVAGQLERGRASDLGAARAGGGLVVAGLYQLTPLKRVCLDHCRSPFGLRDEALARGLRRRAADGDRPRAYCLGCCWALFAVLVAAGVMSLAWMLLLTLVVFAEKVLPFGRRASQVVGVAFLILGVVVAAGAADLPWTA